jgi:hypothetical protein
VIERVDQQLREWIKAVVGPVHVSLGPPDEPYADRGVHLYLMDLIDTPPTRGTTPPPLQLSLRYLLTTWAETPEEAHRLLGELTFAAMESADIEVELGPLPAGTWAAFGVAPQPCFRLRVPLRRERPEREAPPMVRQPLVLRTSPTTNVWGRVLGPEDVPLAGARVELTYLHRSTRTDTKGEFRFPNVPSESLAHPLRVQAKGRVFEASVDRAAQEGDPIVIRVDAFP